MPIGVRNLTLIKGLGTDRLGDRGVRDSLSAGATAATSVPPEDAQHTQTAGGVGLTGYNYVLGNSNSEHSHLGTGVNITVTAAASFEPISAYINDTGENPHWGGSANRALFSTASDDSTAVTGATMSFWVKWPAATNTRVIDKSGSNGTRLELRPTEILLNVVEASSSTDILACTWAWSPVSGQWNHILISPNMETTPDAGLVGWINNVPVTASAGVFTTGRTGDFMWGLPMGFTVNNPVDSHFGEVYSLTCAKAVTTAFARNFIDVSGKPVYLGDFGETPTGVTAYSYFSSTTNVTAFYSNKGYGALDIVTTGSAHGTGDVITAVGSE